MPDRSFLHHSGRHEHGVVQRTRHVAACWDGDSVWVEIAGPKGGNAWQMASPVARALANLLIAAADEATEKARHDKKLLSEDREEIKLVPAEARDLWDPNRPEPVTSERRKAAEEAVRRYRERDDT